MSLLRTVVFIYLRLTRIYSCKSLVEQNYGIFNSSTSHQTDKRLRKFYTGNANEYRKQLLKMDQLASVIYNPAPNKTKPKTLQKIKNYKAI